MERRTVVTNAKDVVLYTFLINPVNGVTTIRLGHGPPAGETQVEKSRRELQESENRERRLRGERR